MAHATASGAKQPVSASAGTPAPHFAHPSEREFARLLDFYRITWQYEPRAFLLRERNGQVAEMFTPDFYLPDLDLYLELTTLRQRLVTKKNRKLRLLRELYPNVNIRLLYKRDYYELLAKYGYVPAEVEPPQFAELLRDAERILFSRREIQQTVTRLAGELTADYGDKNPLLVGVLKGVSFFLADLVRQMPVYLDIDFMSISEFRGGGSGTVKIEKDLEHDIIGRHVILVEDIVDTGLTLRYLMTYLFQREPASLEVCALLDKRPRRLVETPLRYVGFEVGDEFLVGYGLDFRKQYRNLPFISVLKPESYRADLQREDVANPSAG